MRRHPTSSTNFYSPKVSCPTLFMFFLMMFVRLLIGLMVISFRGLNTCYCWPEITSPMEDNISGWHSKKLNRYDYIAIDSKGWTVHFWAVEVGARGWVPPHFRSDMLKLGFTSPEIKSIRNNLSLIARKCSYRIWINRFNKNFDRTRICK